MTERGTGTGWNVGKVRITRVVEMEVTGGVRATHFATPSAGQFRRRPEGGYWFDVAQ